MKLSVFQATSCQYVFKPVFFHTLLSNAGVIDGLGFHQLVDAAIRVICLLAIQDRISIVYIYFALSLIHPFLPTT